MKFSKPKELVIRNTLSQLLLLRSLEISLQVPLPVERQASNVGIAFRAGGGIKSLFFALRGAKSLKEHFSL